MHNNHTPSAAKNQSSLTNFELRQAAIALDYILRETDGFDLEQILAETGRGHLPARISDSLTWDQQELANLLERCFHAGPARCQQAVSNALAGTDWERERLAAILDFAARVRQHRHHAEPERTLLDVCNEVGLDAMLDYSCVRGDNPVFEQTREERRSSSKPAGIVVQMESAGPEEAAAW